MSQQNSPHKNVNQNKGFNIKGLDLKLDINNRGKGDSSDQMRKLNFGKLGGAGDERDERIVEKEKAAYYSEICSEILPDFLYVSSYIVAKNKDLLKQHKITHVINVAADYCENCYPDEFTYLHFYLKDHNSEVK